MSNINYSLISNEGSSNITVFHDGTMYAATDTHPNWGAILAGALSDDTNVVSLFDIGDTASKRFNKLSERVSVRHGQIYFDNQLVNNALTNQVARFIEEGVEDFGPLVQFFENVQSNPNEHSREQLYSWLNTHDFTITTEGNFIGYKGVRTVATTDGTKYESISHGTAISDGVEYTGAIPNPIGAVVEMPRDAVHHDPAVGCNTGLHVGTWGYASDFAQGAVLKIEVNPRDVVSVPTDCSSQKVRACRYKVLEVIDAPVTGSLDYDFISNDEDDIDYGQLDADYEEDIAGFRKVNPDPVVYTMAGSVDTRMNYQKQKRDRFGRFIPKN